MSERRRDRGRAGHGRKPSGTKKGSQNTKERFTVPPKVLAHNPAASSGANNDSEARRVDSSEASLKGSRASLFYEAPTGQSSVPLFRAVADTPSKNDRRRGRDESGASNTSTWSMNTQEVSKLLGPQNLSLPSARAPITIGFVGTVQCGKTTVANALAQALSRSWVTTSDSAHETRSTDTRHVFPVQKKGALSKPDPCGIRVGTAPHTVLLDICGTGDTRALTTPSTPASQLSPLAAIERDDLRRTCLATSVCDVLVVCVRDGVGGILPLVHHLSTSTMLASQIRARSRMYDGAGEGVGVGGSGSGSGKGSNVGPSGPMSSGTTSGTSKAGQDKLVATLVSESKLQHVILARILHTRSGGGDDSDGLAATTALAHALQVPSVELVDINGESPSSIDTLARAVLQYRSSVLEAERDNDTSTELDANTAYTTGTPSLPLPSRKRVATPPVTTALSWTQYVATCWSSVLASSAISDYLRTLIKAGVHTVAGGERTSSGR